MYIKIYKYKSIHTHTHKHTHTHTHTHTYMHKHTLTHKHTHTHTHCTHTQTHNVCVCDVREWDDGVTGIRYQAIRRASQSFSVFAWLPGCRQPVAPAHVVNVCVCVRGECGVVCVFVCA
jgi:hypothetical protein